MKCFYLAVRARKEGAWTPPKYSHQACMGHFVGQLLMLCSKQAGFPLCTVSWGACASRRYMRMGGSWGSWWVCHGPPCIVAVAPGSGTQTDRLHPGVGVLAAWRVTHVLHIPSLSTAYSRKDMNI
jgi:hypothetical protein